MKADFNLLFPSQIDWDKFEDIKPEIPFSDSVIECLNELSKELLKDKESRIYPDVITFAFFCRKGNLLQLKAKYADNNRLRLGRGLLFHIAPSNVPINFGYSLVAGLLAGNKNIVRVSSKSFPQVDIVIKHLSSLLGNGKNDEVLSRIVLTRYDRESEANSIFSEKCNVRVIWGGDSTISSIRKHPIPPRAFDVCFADRYSISAINPSAILAATNIEIRKLAEAFYNDTYLFDQNACSAPHTIFWLKSEDLKEAKYRFWKAVYEYTLAKYNFQPIMAIDKLTAFYRQSVNMSISKEEMPDNIVVRSELKELLPDIEDYRCACGYFSEFTIENINEIAPIINLKYQTLGYFGLEKDVLTDFVINNRLTGLDRIVPIGETTAFALTWDGFNLIDTFTREISIL